MVETNTGIGIMEQLLTGTAQPTPFDAGHARIGVGDGNGSVPVVHATDTALAASTNKVFVGMNSGFPQQSGQVMTWQATFPAGTGTFFWREWGIDNGNGGGPAQLFNHIGVSLGNKTAGTTWTFQVSVTQT